MASHFYPGWRQHYSRQQYRTAYPVAYPKPPPILAFQGCGCTYSDTIREQRPSHNSRLLYVEHVPRLHTNLSFEHDLTIPKIHISGHCRIHEFAQFVAVRSHIIDAEHPKLLEARARNDDAEVGRIQEDVTKRLDGMDEKLMGRWAVLVCVGPRPPMLHFAEGAGFTEEREMHGADKELRRVFIR
jgi:hypothetical protein